MPIVEAPAPPGTKPPEKETYTHADYARLPEGAPYELIGGDLVMAPAPTPDHQRIIGRLFRLFSGFVEEQALGEVFVSPIDVHLSEHDTPQPDLVFVATERAEIVGAQHIEGAPDLVAEVLSPSTGYYDLRGKKRLYEHAGVKEYWIVDPVEGSVEVYENGPDGFVLADRAEGEDVVASASLEGLRVELSALF
jgi:Uma2 family endonuclease